MCRTRRNISRLTICVPCGLLLAAATAADSRFLLAEQDPDRVSKFTIDFGELGASEAHISQTNYILEIDPDTREARFVFYYQAIDPLILPGDISTGNITVRVVSDSSEGEYDPDTREFSTSEEYAIYFEADLRLFGLKSPLVLASDSNGVVDFTSENAGTIQQKWFGSGELKDPRDPERNIPFSYTCEVNTVFTGASCDPYDVNCDDSVDLIDVEAFIDLLLGGENECVDGCSGDMNGDGEIDLLDVDPFIQRLLAP